MNGAKFNYALVLGLLALAGHAWAIDPVDHKPIAELVTALKNSGQERIAQGLEGVLAKDPNTGEMFTARSPLMLTTNKTTGEWTISVFNDKVVGSMLLIGTKLQRISNNSVCTLPTFDRKKAQEVMPKLKEDGSAYYPDEVQRLSKDYGFRRVFSGQVTTTTDTDCKNGMMPVFADVLVAPNGDFSILVVDQYGACAKVAIVFTFFDKP